ncbi:MAG: hypothetical protein K2J07_05095 [Muribaculaceae bacterium]|nr:hypothetical protein [Muribaculaceae bacterium]MDE6832090.1 hypothetical protein [Muribaculaceae bacterium]
MSDIKIAAIMRAGAYSPNHIGNDASILSNVAEQLRKRGCEVTLYSEEQLCRGEVTERIIINMCREARSLQRLEELAEQGSIVVNSPSGISNCIRERQTCIFIGSNIPFPESIITSTDRVVKGDLEARGFGKCWVKRADNYAMHKEDVSYVRTPQEAQEVLQEYFLRGITRAVISKHIKGDIIKFYGVIGSPFFYWYYPYDNEHEHTDPERQKAIESALKSLCAKAAGELGLMVYGGDAVLDDQGRLTIIDFNDWPSFAPCRNAAATAIAKSVIGLVKPKKSAR